MILFFVAATLFSSLPPLTPADAVKIALEKNPQQAVLGANLEEERAKAGLALRFENPELRVGDFRTDRLLTPLVEGRPADASIEDTRFGIRWSPPSLQDFGPRQLRANARIAQREAQVRSGRFALAARVKRLHARMRNLEGRVQLATKGRALADKMRQVIRDRTEAGVSTQLELSLSELEYLDAAADLEELQAKFRVSRREFVSTLGLAAETLVKLLAPKSDACRTDVRDIDGLIARATEASPQMHAVAARVDEVDAQLLGTWLAFAPWFDFVQVAYSPGAVGESGVGRLRFGITLPVFDFQRGDAAVLRARKIRHEAEARAVRLEIGADIRKSADDIKNQKALTELYARSQREVLDGGLLELEAALERGDVDLVEVSLLRSRVLRAKRSMLRTHLDCEHASISLAFRTGTILDDLDNAPHP